MKERMEGKNDEFSIYRKIISGPAVAKHGQVFTRNHVVDFMLDLAGYTADHPLGRMTLLEPGSGNGAFITAAANRLLIATTKKITVEEHAKCLLGVEKNSDLVDQTRIALMDILTKHGIDEQTVKELANAWVVCADFLEMAPERRFDFVVGNPPYVRQEAIEKELVERYRQCFSCFYDRADLYVAFFERGLALLSEQGTLAFICPNRFTKNNYGRKLRQRIAEQFRLTHVVDLPEASPFEPEVLSYPGIYVVQRGRTESVEHLLMKDGSLEECQHARNLLEGKTNKSQSTVVYHRYESWFSGENKWATHSPEHLSLLRRLESEGVPIGSNGSGCKVGIGVATGADDIFILGKDRIDVEEDLLLPLVTTKDISSGKLCWEGTHLINPFDADDSGRLIELARYPKAREYFESHRERLCNRHVGRRNPEGWYRTIDRVYRYLTRKPMILIPDIKGNNETFALKEGDFYPHHNLYYVTSDSWDLRMLRAILRSDIARFFVFMYGVKMRQGYYRFQAQYLRRIVLPPRIWVSKAMVEQIVDASLFDDTEKLNELLAALYRLSPRDRKLLRSFDEAA